MLIGYHGLSGGEYRQEEIVDCGGCGYCATLGDEHAHIGIKLPVCGRDSQDYNNEYAAYLASTSNSFTDIGGC